MSQRDRKWFITELKRNEVDWGEERCVCCVRIGCTSLFGFGFTFIMPTVILGVLANKCVSLWVVTQKQSEKERKKERKRERERSAWSKSFVFD